MLILEPISLEKIWGTPRLQKYGGVSSIDKIGAVYTVAGTRELNNGILNSPYQESNLYDAVRNNNLDFGLPEGIDYPIIIAFTGADEDLSIQVHPTDEYARAKEDKKIGKSESWYFIDVPLEGEIYSGAKEMDKSVIFEEMQKGNYKKIVDKLAVSKKDLVFIPSGTLHALTKGSLVYEIQQSTDITYRFFDFNRVDKDGKPRKLHLDKAISSLDITQTPKKFKLKENVEYKEYPYTIEKTNLQKSYTNKNSIADAITVLNGELIIGNQSITQGNSLIVFPNEKIDIDKGTECMIATPHIYWE